MTQLKGRVAIVTGEGRGLDELWYSDLLKRTCVVATATRQRAELEAVAREAQQSCGEARVLPEFADVTKMTTASRSFKIALRPLGALTFWSWPCPKSTLGVGIRQLRESVIRGRGSEPRPRAKYLRNSSAINSQSITLHHQSSQPQHPSKLVR
jgi:NAD(P)-dependent dehydrogenase (short-subunit alcohol dehydrogenase family)